MTDQPEPIRKNLLPCTPPPEWEFSTVFGARTDTEGCALFPGDAGPVVIRRRVSYGDWEPVRPDRWASEAPQGATGGRLSAAEGSSRQRETPEGRNGPQAGADGFQGEPRPRGPVDWARHQAAERETQAAGEAWTPIRARAFNAVQPALRQAGEWLPLSARRAVADAVLAELKRELDALAEYENTINWMTTCTGCARVLDSAYAETARAEHAEAAVARVRALAARIRQGVPWTANDTEIAARIEAALDQPPAHDAGPSVREAATQDRAYWAAKYAGEDD